MRLMRVSLEKFRKLTKLGQLLGIFLGSGSSRTMTKECTVKIPPIPTNSGPFSEPKPKRQ